MTKWWDDGVMELGSQRFVSADGHRLECMWIGAPPEHAPTLVFLHEGLGSVSLWRDFPATVCRHAGCGGLVYSRWGYGNSDPVDRPRSTRFMHDEGLIVLPQVLDAFAITRPILVGHSDGASVAIVYAGSDRGEVAGLVLEAPHVFVEDVTIASIRDARTRYETMDLRPKLARHHAHVDSMFEAWTSAWLRPEFREWTIEEYLPSIRCPALVIQGENDEYGTLNQVEAIIAGVRGESEAVILPACGHAPHVDQRAAVEEAMTQFIRRVLTARAAG